MVVSGFTLYSAEVMLPSSRNRSLKIIFRV
jgi:hypothetical protein